MKRLPLKEIRRVIARSFGLTANFGVSELAGAIGLPVAFVLCGKGWRFRIGFESFVGEDPVEVFTSGMESIHRRLLNRRSN